MQLIRGLHNLTSPLPASAVSLGNFDGIHLGHQRLLMTLKQHAQAQHLKSVVVVFEPQPKEYFTPDNSVARLMRFSEKYRQLRQLGIDYLCCLYFNKYLATLTATDFVCDILLKKLAMQAVIIGHDFHFGAKRQGDCALLQTLGQQFNFSVTALSAVTLEEQVVSSTRIRAALQHGNLPMATQLLGRPYSLGGKVSYGQQRGRLLGFPTANINLHRAQAPLNGVFVVRARLGDEVYAGVANIGSRPTFAGQQVLLEVHLFDFAQIIYGQYLTVEFLHKIRDEQRFSSVESLQSQLAQDVAVAKDMARTYR